MIIVTIAEMAANAEQLVEAVRTAGQQVVITDQNVPFATLQPIRRAEVKREFGAQKDLYAIGPEFFDPLSEEELNAWEE